MSTGQDPERTADPAPDVTRGAGAGTGDSEAGGSTVRSGRSFASTGAPTATASGAGLVFDDPFDRVSADDTDRGWGGSSADTADEDFTRFLNEKPPHHL